MSDTPVRYRSADEDSGRWVGFPFRQGDIVISTRSKSGTTWVQMICALLVFQTPELAAPLSSLSPWLDWLITPRDDVYAQLEAQNHRRFIKTHTPLDGLPFDPRVTYLVTGRHPLDIAESLYHHSENINRPRLRQLTGQPSQKYHPRPRPPVHEWVLEWIERDDDPREQPDSLPGIMLHLTGAWSRRNEPQVVVVHYSDLSNDLQGGMMRLADVLDMAVPAETWPELVRAATFGEMRNRSEMVAPDPSGILNDKSAFFRRGMSGGGRELLTAGELARYHERAAQLAPPDLLEWLHR
jgi:hypothetical protein